MKRLLIDTGVVIGNIFLSHALFVLPSVSEFLNDGFVFVVTFCTIMIAVNIILYKILLKRHFKPVENRKTAFYFLLPVIGCALWIGSLVLTAILGLGSSLETYSETLIFFLPAILLTLIPLTVVYRIFFRKYVSEAYCTYLLSVLGVAIIPVTYTVIMIGTG